MIVNPVISAVLASLAGEKQGAHHEAVRREDQLLPAGEDGSVPQPGKLRVLKGLEDALLNQPGGFLPPAAIVQSDDLVHKIYHEGMKE